MQNFESSSELDIPISHVRAMNAPTQQLDFSGTQTSVPVSGVNPRAPAAPTAASLSAPAPARGFPGNVAERNKVGRCAGFKNDEEDRSK
jgi:hypothetical protein